jgi:hypothetical protein
METRGRDHKTPEVEQTEGDGILEIEESSPEPPDDETADATETG